MQVLFLIANKWIPEIREKDPEKRPSAEELMKHPFLQRACEKKFIAPIIDLVKELAAQDQFEDF